MIFSSYLSLAGSGKLVIEGQHIGLDEDLAQAARVPSHGERAAPLPATVARVRGLRRGLLVNGGQNDEALLVLLHEAVHALVLILIEAHFLPNGSQVEADGRVRNHHLEAQLAHLHGELLYRFRALLVPVVDRQRLLDLLC